MVKRKHNGRRAEPQEDVEMNGADGEDESEEEFDIIDVSFEMFDPQPAHDFHGIRTLLRQLFDIDSTLFDLSKLTDLILAQPLLGTTVKVDTNEGDPYAFLTVLNLTQREHEPEWHGIAKSLREYILAKAKDAQDGGEMHKLLESLLPIPPPPQPPSESDASSTTSKTPIQGTLGIILTERLINVPTEVSPPMYKMLLEEVQWAIDDHEPYNFTHYLIISKTYTEIAPQADSDSDSGNIPIATTSSAAAATKSKKFKSSFGKRVAPPKQKQKKSDLFYFHPEDELLQKEAAAYRGYRYTKESELVSADARRAFTEMGIAPQGHMILIGKEGLERTVPRLEEAFKP